MCQGDDESSQLGAESRRVFRPLLRPGDLLADVLCQMFQPAGGCPLLWSPSRVAIHSLSAVATRSSPTTPSVALVMFRRYAAMNAPSAQCQVSHAAAHSARSGHAGIPGKPDVEQAAESGDDAVEQRAPSMRGSASLNSAQNLRSRLRSLSPIASK